MELYIFALLGAIIMSHLTGGVESLCQGTTKTFTAMTDSTILSNPGKGFYHTGEFYASNYQSLALADLQSMRVNEKITLFLMEFVLDTFLTANISSTFITKARADFATVRSAGLKSIVRFSYTQTDGNMNDAQLPQLRNHIAQLAAVLKENEDVILAVQAGFVGTWGEWYYSVNYATKKVDSTGGVYYEPSATQQAARNTIIDDLLSALPATRQVQVRTPTIKQKFCNTTANIDASQAFSTTSKCSRLGIHNDCFMAAWQDAGTFETDAQRTWLTSEGLYAVVGGETCEANSQTACTGALDQIAKQRFTYLNVEYHDTVVANWKTGGCFNAIANKLGYRFVVSSGVFPSSVTRGATFCATLTVQNTGVAPVYNRHLVQVVLRNKADGTLSYYTQSAIDIRKWAPGTSSTMDLTLAVPSSLAAGTYDVLLNLPDASASLTNNVNYRILLANGGGVQETATRFNLLAQVTLV